MCTEHRPGGAGKWGPSQTRIPHWPQGVQRYMHRYIKIPSPLRSPARAISANPEPAIVRPSWDTLPPALPLPPPSGFPPFPFWNISTGSSPWANQLHLGRQASKQARGVGSEGAESRRLLWAPHCVVPDPLQLHSLYITATHAKDWIKPLFNFYFFFWQRVAWCFRSARLSVDLASALIGNLSFSNTRARSSYGLSSFISSSPQVPALVHTILGRWLGNPGELSFDRLSGRK